MRVMRGQPIKDASQNGIPLDQCFAISEAEHVEAQLFQLGSAALVVLCGACLEMLAAIELDDQARLNAREVGEEPAHRMLATEFVAAELTIAQTQPNGALGIG